MCEIWIFWILLDFIPNLDLFHPVFMYCYMERVHVGIIGVFYSQGLCFLFLEKTLSFSFQVQMTIVIVKLEKTQRKKHLLVAL